MLDPCVLLGMLALLLLLESIDFLVAWAQKQDVYICDFAGALQKYEQQLFMYYTFNLLLKYNHESIIFKRNQN
jgi:hypothetical protein